MRNVDYTHLTIFLQLYYQNIPNSRVISEDIAESDDNILEELSSTNGLMSSGPCGQYGT